MDIQKMFEAMGLINPPGPMHFSERDGMVTYDVGVTQSVGELVADFANLVMDRRDEQRNLARLIIEIDDILSSKIQEPEDQSLQEKIFVVGKKYGNTVFAWVIWLLVHESYYNGSKDMIIYFGDNLKDMCLFCRSYIKGRELKTSKAGITLDSRIFTDKDGLLRIEYSTRSASAIVYFHLLRLQELGQRPNICRVCGRAFFPVSKSNELYCRKQYGDGRYCANIAAANREKDVSFYSLYRTAYKTMYARMKRKGNNEIAKGKFKKWKTDAASKLIEYEREGDIEGYKQWLEDNKI